MSIKLESVPPLDAIRAYLARGGSLDPSFNWLDVWEEGHAASFTVARSTGYDVLNDIFEALLKALAEGQTYRQFAAELTPLLQAKGWWGRQMTLDPITRESVVSQLGSARRLQTIFDANMRVSYAAGHWTSFERSKVYRPYLRYVAILDEATRPQHAARHNLVLPVDDPYWDWWAPPCGWNCRCTLQSVSERDVERLQRQGVDLKFTAPALDLRPYLNKRTGEISQVPDGIDPGWAYNPGKAGWSQVLKASQTRLGGGPL
jgi:SPP1 gp7 family putative phage head morphogenesis protein